ncbi:protein phosphatase 2C domain-containing protein [Leifsonia sp. Leaf264]|uniref:protein phosphatase 2C domain-containing protein n=1 Tax=Leifsonia sp. Leaf264 TaxID=1736314 RepID=UPI0006FCFFDC|nr:protein phosphatase 2C domain-containing protein [Leifsonia sp. Leaf264]KQO98833.1 hypothetical protein ASF30_12280 [Leifsonia sp. Leaf264]
MAHNLSSSTYARGRRSFSEDAFAVTSDAAIVLDGASGLGGEQITDWGTDVEWFSHTLTQQLAATVSGPGTLHDIAAEAVAAVADTEPGRTLSDPSRPTEFRPSAAGAIARVRDGKLQVLSFADVSAVVFLTDGTFEELNSPVLLQLDADMLAAAQSEADARGITAREGMKYVHDAKVFARRHMNTPHGYSVLTLDGAGIPLATYREWDATQVTDVILATDGYAAAVEIGLFDDWDHLRRTVTETSLHIPAIRLLQAYDNDPDFITYPRSKHVDDITAVHVRVGRG